MRENRKELERAMRFELTTPTLARLCSTPELRPLDNSWAAGRLPATGGVRLQARNIPRRFCDASVSFDKMAVARVAACPQAVSPLNEF
jgi:hypothetical protein